MSKAGKFIVFEGIDGSGKSTMSKLIHDAINEKYANSYHTFEPTDSPIGSVIRNILKKRIETDEKTIAALFLADRLDHLQNKSNGILKCINEGKNVICDRYYYSSYAYHVPHLPLDWIIEVNKECANLLRPDVVFFMDLSVEESLSRISKNRNFKDLYETEGKIKAVRENYEAAILKEGAKDNVIRIDAHRSVDEIFEEVWAITDELIGGLAK